MRYRRTSASDRIAIKEMATKYNLSYDGREPLIGWVAEGEDGNLVGASYAHKTAIIDPFFCPEPMGALKLFVSTIASLSALEYGTVIMQVQEVNDKLKDELKRFGFEKVDRKYSMFKKVF